MTYNGTTVSTTNGNTAAVSVTVPVLGSAVSDILINCSNLYSVSGTITGLDANASGMTLALNGSVLSTVSGGDTSFSFPVPDGLLASGDTYEVTVQTQPTPDTGGKWQNCAVSLGTGTISADVSNVVIACTTSTYTIGGTIVGLTGTGLTIQHVSTDNAPTISETLSIASGATTFTFPTPQQSGTTYTISISSAAVGQVCRVLNPTGTVLGGTKTTLTDSSGTDLNTSGTTVDPNVTNIIINCESGAMISGTVTGYNGNGLRLRKQYTTGGTSPTPTDESIWISTNGSFAFPNLGTASQNYTISIQNNPWGPSQTCKIQDGNEAANTTSITATVASTPVDITDIVVTCTTNTYANLIVNIVNYASPIGAGLVVINNSSGVTANVSVGDTTANLDSNVESGKTYDISVSTQPTDHNCIVFNGQGTVWGSGTTNVYINCEPKYNEVVTYHWSARGYYRLGEASGSFADSIATAANASLNASSDAKYVGLGLISGDTNASAYFTGTGYAEAATTTKYDFTTNLSLEAWIVPYSLTGTIIDKGTNYSLNLNSGKVQLCVGGTCYESSATLTLGKKYHIIGTYYVGTNGARIYINGVKDSSHTSSVTASASSSKLRIGANSSGTNNFTGIIDDVSIYRYNLGDQRATLNYRWGSRLTTEYDFAGVLTDSSTYGNTVTATNSPSTVTDENGLANGAYSFSGTNQYMSISSGISTPYTQSFLTNKLTLSAWVMPTSTTSGYIVHSGDASSGYGLRVASNRLEVFSGTNVALSTTTLPTGKWIHVAAVRASNSWTLYLNGKQEATSNASATVTKPSSSSKFTIGADSSFSTNFNGSISRVKVYHAALSAAEIRNLAISVPTGILAYYSFSSGTGTDTGFIGNTGTYTNLGSDRLGLTVSAATFDGSQSFSLTPIGFSNSQSSTRTLCAWVNWSTLPTSGQTQTIMQYTDTVGLSVTNTGGTYSLNVEGFSANLTTPATSSWYHICAASNGSSYTLYQDGTALTNTATVYNATGSITKLQIGQNITSANGFNGSIDDIRIYNRALIASEITALSGNK
ncbi:MAG: LamG domain-containing protein [Leptospiraceae bacterium]|nr:LamG domain-containing protein [Leptospiraceae bacterium]